MVYYQNKDLPVPRFSEANGFYTTKERSNLMKKITSKGTKPEEALRKALWHKGVRYRKNVAGIKGKPDIVIRKYGIIVFVDGSFWHGYNWEEKKTRIKSNREFWIPKIERNIQRDFYVNQELKGEGWIVIRFWDHEVKKNLGLCVETVMKIIEGSG